MPEPELFDDELVLASPWGEDLLVQEMEAHGQIIVHGSHRSQHAALRTLQAHYGDREVGARAVHGRSGMELTVLVSNPGFSGDHQCIMVPRTVAKQLDAAQESGDRQGRRQSSPPMLRPWHEAPGEFRTSLMLTGWSNSTFGWDGPAASYFAVLEADDGREPVWLSGVRKSYSTLHSLEAAIATATGISPVEVAATVNDELAQAGLGRRMLR